ncbi:hypothetical protein M433DRAFT_61505 [Acidomyces richmondensis BFW]|nr:MAG: hypothetical protein FE78DRAFT_138226 [Acidomyces sp. 'richmondensis']KYG48236.1 hypothetical protein M433DRAFT_61505 [Acidomyces richmondensis BFW]
MWLLSTPTSNLFGGKILWLRPGSRHLLGRTSGRPEDGERIQVIDHRSVSRKHLLIEIGELQVGDISRINERTQILLTDSSKVGTKVDGDRFVKQTRTIGGRGGGNCVLDLQLGHYDVHFQLEWREIILTCTNVSKKNKGNKEDAEFEDSLEGKKQQVLDAGLDVKVVSEYVTNRTSHVVGKKRNTAISLQALVQGKWVVGYGFLDALTKTARKEDKNVILPLEFDFNAHWPHEQDYIIEAGANELQPRPNHYLLPKPERAEVFQGYTFIFLSQSQYDQLRPVVTAGGGTALLFVVTLGQTKVDEVVNYIREVADANIFDSILPGQAALKRRKIVAANAGASAFPLSATGAANKAVRKEQRETQMDVKAELKARREAEEERRKRDEEALRQMTETDVSKLRHLAKVEEFELPVRELSDARRAGENGSRSERWDPKWNGRKNFKKFRPQGLRQDDGVAKSRLQRVIVTLEEVPRKGHGLGDEYWLRTSPTAGRGEDVQGKRAGGNHGKRNQVQAETQYENGNAASSEAFQRTLQRSREQDAEAAAAAQAFDNIEIAGTARDEIHRTSEAVAPQGILAEALVLDSQRIKTKPAGKRPAVSMSQPYFEGPLGKKARRGMTKSTARNLMDREEEDDGEELKFRRRRR